MTSAELTTIRVGHSPDSDDAFIDRSIGPVSFFLCHLVGRIRFHKEVQEEQEGRNADKTH